MSAVVYFGQRVCSFIINRQSANLVFFPRSYYASSWRHRDKIARASLKSVQFGVGLLAAGSVIFLMAQKYSKIGVVHALKPRKRDELTPRAVKLTMRERRFIKFASVEYDGQLYMTPQDFLDSVVESEPRPRLKRRVLSDQELEVVRNAIPSLRHGSPHMFRNLRDKGIISYTEYLFLLSILTKPKTGFQIAFNMFDTDGNERVDKTEFLVIRKLLGGSLREREVDEATRKAVSFESSNNNTTTTIANTNSTIREEQKTSNEFISHTKMFTVVFLVACRDV